MSEYSGYDVKQLWRMVDAARQGLQPSHDQVAALNKAQQMLSGHAQSLEQARDQLASRWPPEINTASAAYLGELDRLIAAVRDTALSCAVNVFHMNTVCDAIVQAHDALAPLHDEFVKNEKALALYDAEINAFGDGATGIPGSSTVARSAGKLFTSPPVKAGRQDHLTRQAQEAMVPLAGAAQDGASYIKPPAHYEPPIVNGTYIEDPKQIGGQESAGGASAPPAVGPPAYAHPAVNDASTGGSERSSSTIPSRGGSGPSLSGYTSTPIQHALTAPPIGAENPIRQPSGLVPGPGTPIGGFGTRLPGVLAPEGAGSGRGRFSSGGAPRGGVIGTVSEVTGATGSKPSQANPPGGAISQQPTAGGKSRTAASRAPGGGMGVDPQTSRWGRTTAKASRQHWDPDNPWEVDEGVDPVIKPDAAPGPVDPGPGIIGLTR